MIQPYYDEPGVNLFHGDCIEVMRTFEANRFPTCITDAPYELNFMGRKWDNTGIAFRPETWAEVLRVCKPGATLLAAGGTRTWHRLACAIEDAGWEIRDCIMWMYGSGMPHGLDISKAIDKAAGATREVVGTRIGQPGVSASGANYGQGFSRAKEGRVDRPSPALDLTAPATAAARLWSGWNTALKPSYEPWILAMKPLDGTYAENALRHGVAGLNIAGGRIGLAGERPPTGSGDRRSSNVYAQDEWSKTQMANGGNVTAAAGRWPANVILDEAAAAELDARVGTVSGGDERGQCDGERPGGFGNVGSENGNGKPCGTLYPDRGGPSRFFKIIDDDTPTRLAYFAKASKSDRGDGNNHATVKPLALMRYLANLTKTPTGGEVLDPFNGSGTTTVACVLEGRPCVGIEQDEEHVRIQVARHKALAGETKDQGSLFTGGAA